MTQNLQKTAIAAAIFAASSLAVSISANAATFDVYSELGFDQATTAVGPAGSGTVSSDNAVTGGYNLAAGTWNVASTNTYFGYTWTASNGHLITTAGDYALNTLTDTVSAASPDTTGTLDSMIHFTVGAGQIAGTIDWSWNGNTGTRVVNVWNVNSDGSLTAVYAPGAENGPLVSFNFTFTNLQAVPVPAAAWLFGSGLLGLIGITRRKRSA